jgi:hypothetical protein
VKGAALAAVFDLAGGLSLAISRIAVGSLPVGVGDWFFRAFELTLFLVVLGVLLDWQTLKQCGTNWRYLKEYYRVADLQFGTAYASAAVTALAVIAQQLQSGHAQGGVTAIAKSVSTLIPPIPH